MKELVEVRGRGRWEEQSALPSPSVHLWVRERPLCTDVVCLASQGSTGGEADAAPSPQLC